MAQQFTDWEVYLKLSVTQKHCWVADEYPSFSNEENMVWHG